MVLQVFRHGGAGGGLPAGWVDATSATYGADKTGATNTHVALQAALTAAAGGVLVIPPGSYRVGDLLAGPSNITIWAYGAKFLSYDTDLGNSNGAGNPILQFTDATNVRVYGLELDGRQTAWASSEFKHGLGLNGVDGALLVDVYAHDCKGDGIYTGSDNIAGGRHNKNVTLIRCRTNDNFRGGLTITDAENYYCYAHQSLRNTGTSPMFGLDIEPDADASVIHNLHFYGGTFSDNGVGQSLEGSGIYVTLRATPTALQEGIYFHGGRATGNQLSGLTLYHSRKVVFEDFLVHDNVYNAVEFKLSANDVSFRNCDFSAVAASNRHALVVGNINANVVTNIRVVGGRLAALGAGNAVFMYSGGSNVVGLTLDGVALSSATGKAIVNRSNMTYLRLLNITQLDEGSATSLLDDTATRRVVGTKGLADYPASGADGAPHPGLRSGVYYGAPTPIGTVLTTHTLTADRLAGHAFYVPTATVFTGIGWRHNTAGAAGKVYYAGVYQITNGVPGALVAGSAVGPTAADVAGVDKALSFTSPITLAMGWYFLALVSDGAPVVNGYQNHVLDFFGTTIGAGSNSAGYFKGLTTGTYSAVPDPFPSGGAATGTVPRLLLTTQ